MNQCCDKPALEARLNRIEGQLRGIRAMISADKACEDVLTQILAVDAALKNVGKIILTDHLNHCVKDAIIKGEDVTLDRFNTILSKFIN